MNRPIPTYDVLGRMLIRLSGQSFLEFLLNRRLPEGTFVRWRNTTDVVDPLKGQRTADNVAELRDEFFKPWLGVMELKSEPDPDAGMQALDYLADACRSIKPDAAQGSRFEGTAIVVCMTGTQREVKPALFFGDLRNVAVQVFNIAGFSAVRTMDDIESGRLDRWSLPWTALMHDATDATIVNRWRTLAEQVPNRNDRNNLATVALVFAEAVGRAELWESGLEGFNMRQSSILEEWLRLERNEAQEKGELIGQIRLLQQLNQQMPMSKEDLRQMNLDDLQALVDALQITLPRNGIDRS